MLSSSTQFSTVDAKGIFALFLFLMPRQKEFMSLSIKDLANAFERIASFFFLYKEDLLTYKNLQKYATKYIHMYNMKYNKMAA